MVAVTPRGTQITNCDIARIPRVRWNGTSCSAGTGVASTPVSSGHEGEGIGRRASGGRRSVRRRELVCAHDRSECFHDDIGTALTCDNT